MTFPSETWGLPSGCSPPDITALGKKRGLDDFRRHPRVGAGSAHLGGLVPLPRQAKVCDLERLPPDVIVLYLLK